MTSEETYLSNILYNWTICEFRSRIQSESNSVIQNWTERELEVYFGIAYTIVSLVFDQLKQTNGNFSPPEWHLTFDAFLEIGSCWTGRSVANNLLNETLSCLPNWIIELPIIQLTVQKVVEFFFLNGTVENQKQKTKTTTASSTTTNLQPKSRNLQKINFIKMLNSTIFSAIQNHQIDHIDCSLFICFCSYHVDCLHACHDYHEPLLVPWEVSWLPARFHRRYFS